MGDESSAQSAQPDTGDNSATIGSDRMEDGPSGVAADTATAGVEASNVPTGDNAAVSGDVDDQEKGKDSEVVRSANGDTTDVTEEASTDKKEEDMTEEEKRAARRAERRKKRKMLWDTTSDNKKVGATQGGTPNATDNSGNRIVIPPIPGTGPLLSSGPGMAQTTAMQQMVQKKLQEMAMKQQMAHAQLQQAAAKVYISNLHPMIGEEDIRAIFSPFGPINAIQLGKDPQQTSGFALLEFQNPLSAQVVGQFMSGFVILGRPMQVSRPTPQGNGFVPMPPGNPMLAPLQVRVALEGAQQAAVQRNQLILSKINNPVMVQQLQQQQQQLLLLQQQQILQQQQTRQQLQMKIQQLMTNPQANAATISQQQQLVQQQLIQQQQQQLQTQQVLQSAAALPQLPTRLYISGINPQVTSNHLKEVFQTFGSVSEVQLVPDDAGKHRGLGYLEYTDAAAADAAISQMNGFELAKQKLVVNKNAVTAFATVLTGTTLPNEPAPMAQVAAAVAQAVSDSQTAAATNTGVSAPLVSATPSAAPTPAAPALVGGSGLLGSGPSDAAAPGGADEGSALAREEELHVRPDQKAALMQKLQNRTLKSRVIVLTNMVDADGVDDDLENEVSDECQKFGDVDHVVIYEEDQSDTGDVIVKIFVKFHSMDEATNAAESLDGRWFGGRQISAKFYDESKFARRDLSA
eukprot:Rmarinus@m.16149